MNLNTNTPAAPLGFKNVHWQNDRGTPAVNVSAYVTYPTYQVACPTSGDLSGPVNAVLALFTSGSGGIIDARACTAATSWTNGLNLNFANTVVLLPCATLTATQTFTVTAGTRNTVIHGCGYQGGSTASGTTGGTVWQFQGSGPAFAVGDPTHATDTKGFLLDNMNINTANANSASQAIHFYRTQEIRLDNLYLNGDGGAGQTAITLDGTGNYSGGTFIDVVTSQYNTAWLLTGHLSGSVVDDYANASTFIKPHIDCPTSGGSPVTGTYGFNIIGGDGNTIVGGDVEGCDTVMHLASAATANTVVGMRIEVSNHQYTADSGSSFNSVTTGGTFATGQLTDAGSRNSFRDAFHHTDNGMAGDWYASQQDATVTDHQRLGTGAGNERGRLSEIQTDYGYRWISGYTDAVAGEQFYDVYDVLNSVHRLSIGQYNSGVANTNNQTALNSAGTGAVILNGSTNSGTGGVIVGSGGANPTVVANIDGNGAQTLNSYLRFYASSAEAWRFNCASASACNLDSWTTGSAVHHIRMYNGASTEIDSEGTSAVTVNNTASGGTGGFTVYGGGATYYNTSMFHVGWTGSGVGIYQFPGVAAPSGRRCLDVDTSGWLYYTSSDCGSGGGGGGVTEVKVTAPADFTLSGCDITTSGTCAFTWAATASGTAPLWNQNTSGNAATANYATTAGGAPPTGSCSGDLSGTEPGCSVVKVNGGAPPTSDNVGGWNSSGQPVAAPNTYGCLDGFDHLPCTVYEMGLTSQSAVTGSYATAFTTSAAGFYRIHGNVYATTTSTTSYIVSLLVKQSQISNVASHGLAVASATIGTGEGWNNGQLITQNLASSTAIQWETTGSGTNTGGVWRIDLSVERIK
jgi:hypothetical protein